MDYRELAKDLLQRSNQLVEAKQSLQEEIKELEDEADYFKAHGFSPERLTDYPEKEQGILSIVATLNDCRFRLNFVKSELKKIDRGLCTLTDYQKKVIQFCFIDREKYTTEDIVDMLHKERSCVYKDKDKALLIFTRGVYGLVIL